MYNYEELKDLVNHSSYKMRKKFDLFLNKWMPNTWIPLYSMVTFTRIPYSQVVENRKWQDKVGSRRFSRLLLQVLQRMRSVFTVGTIAVIVGGVICAKKHGVFARYH